MPSNRLVTALLDLVVPCACAGCDMPGPALCDGCVGRLASPPAVGCLRCGHPWAVSVASCAECPQAVSSTQQAIVYDTLAARVMSTMKDSRRRAVAQPLARVMLDRLHPPPPDVVLVPVPLSPARMRERGFNQAAVIAQTLGRAWGLPVAAVLVRDDAASRQRGASRVARIGQVRGAFRATRPAPHHVVLVDDVLTTGATLTAAARALRSAGCARVGAVVTARVVLGRGVTRVG